jgi:Chaperone of endosialidase
VPSTYSQNLRIELIASGEQGNTWGNTTNNNLGTLIEQAISGYLSLATGWSANAITLTAFNGANDQSRNMYLEVPSSVGFSAEGEIVAPTVPKMYVIKNMSSGGFAVRIKTGASATTCLIPNGQTKVVVCNGTEFSEAVTAAAYLSLANAPLVGAHATNKTYVDTADDLRLRRDGTQNMTGELILSSGGTPVSSLAAVSKQYVTGTFLPLAGGTMTGALTLVAATPTGNQAVSRTYLDTRLPGIADATTLGLVNGSGNVTINPDGSMTAPTGGGGGSITNVSGTLPISVANGSTTPVISISLASASTNGYLSATDWDTFNRKVSTATLNSYVLISSLPTVTVGTATNAQQLGGILASSYVTSSSLTATLSNYALNSALGNYVLISSLPSATVGTATNANQLGGVAASSYVTSSSLSTTLSNYALNSALGNYVLTSSLSSATVGTAGTCTGNSATASAPSGGGSFITSLNIGSQNVFYAQNSNNAVRIDSNTTYTFTSPTYNNATASTTGAIFRTQVGGGAAPITAINSNNTGSNGAAIFLVRTNSSNSGPPTGEGAYVSFLYGTGPISGAGIISQGGGTQIAYATGSDYRLKQNVAPLTGAIDRIAALNPVTFEFIANPGVAVDGFLAHEVAEVVPNAINGQKDAVDEDGDPIYQGIDQAKIVPLLVAAIQELKAEIDALKGA